MLLGAVYKFAYLLTYTTAITDHAVEENHVIDWDKAKWSTERHSDRPDG